jgi:twitching motility protein PilT
MGTPTQAAQALVPPPPRKFDTAQLITAMLKAHAHVSDLIFSPGRAPQIEVSGQLVELKFKGLESLTPQDTYNIARDLMGKNEHPIRKLEQEGSADLSYGIGGVGRFRVNIFRQRGSCAVVMRVIPDRIPSFEELQLPQKLRDIVHLRNGIVLVTGPTGSGKSSTLAAVIDTMNTEKAFHILTIEDPIEFLHKHKKATIHQRELHSDTPTFALALRAALRQAPKIILVGEMRDRETMEIALEASETGHLVLSTLHCGRVSHERSARDSKPAFQSVSLHYFAAAFASQRWQGQNRRHGNPYVDHAHSRVCRKRGNGRQIPARRHARWRHRRHAAL